MTEFQPLLNEHDAASMLNVSAGTLRNWRSKGDGPPFIRVGSAIRYAPEGLRQYVEARTRNATVGRGKAA
jgi:predicted site-specific integrase-resolvase